MDDRQIEVLLDHIMQLVGTPGVSFHETHLKGTGLP